MTDRDATSAMQLMAACEAEVQFWRRPSHPQFNVRRRVHSSQSEREQKREQHLDGRVCCIEDSNTRSHLTSGLTRHAASQKLPTNQMKAVRRFTDLYTMGR